MTMETVIRKVNNDLNMPKIKKIGDGQEEIHCEQKPCPKHNKEQIDYNKHINLWNKDRSAFVKEVVTSLPLLKIN